MRTWTRTTTAGQVCGRCGAVMAVGDPVLRLTLKTITVLRCGVCEQAPPDLPAQIVVEAAPVPQLRPLAGLLPLGFTRDPGQEG